MKCFLLLCLLLSSYTSKAQQDSTKQLQEKLYLGIGFSTVSYHIYYDEPKSKEEAAFAYFAPLSLNLGYRFNNRTCVQVGVAYGGSAEKYRWIPGARDTLVYDTYGRTHVIAVPVTVRQTIFKAYKRFPVYATATIMPALGTTTTKIEETRHGTKTISVDRRDTGVNTFFTAGLGFNYKISRSFNGFFEYHAFKYNLAGENSVFYDWDQGARGFYKFFRTIGLGVNYNLKRKER